MLPISFQKELSKHKAAPPALQCIAPLGWASLLLRYRDNLTPGHAANPGHRLYVASSWPWSAVVAALALGWSVSVEAMTSTWRDSSASKALVAVLAGIPTLFMPASQDLLAWADPDTTSTPYLMPGAMIKKWADNFISRYIAATPLSEGDEAKAPGASEGGRSTAAPSAAPSAASSAASSASPPAKKAKPTSMKAIAARDFIDDEAKVSKVG